MTGTRSVRDVLWDACRDKACCHTTRVVLTGADLARLTAAFELPAAALAMAVPLASGTPGGFLLRPHGPSYELVLRKRGQVEATGAPCVFLAYTNDGHAFCGAGPVKPACCRAFPATLSEGRLRVVAQCRCRRWSPLDLDQRGWSLAETAAADLKQHGDAVREWNDQVRGQDRERSVDDFCRYLILRCGA